MIFGDTDLMTVNAGRMARSRSDLPVESGYRDVFNSSGELVWSVVHAAKIPRIIGFYDIPVDFDLDSAAYSQYIGTDTWILASNAPELYPLMVEIRDIAVFFDSLMGLCLANG